MSMMEKMSFFLELQVSKNPRGIFFNQSKYAFEMLKKYSLENCDAVDTPIVERSNLMRILLTRRDIEANPTEKHLTMVKRVFRYLKGINMGQWYMKDIEFDLIAFADANHVVQYHFIKEQVENEVVELYFVRTAYHLVDIFTKALGRERFEFLLNRLGMQSITLEELKSLAESDEE
ncbi:hypothetical protein Tco_1367346 [Tanacetum coccineum]